MSYKIDRNTYAQTYGPTTGDRVRLADTELFIEVEKDLTSYGDEVKFGGGKVIRDGMGQSQVRRADGAVDTVITNALIVDWWGIIKADVGIKDGMIFEIGKAGNPDIRISGLPAFPISKIIPSFIPTSALIIPHQSTIKALVITVSTAPSALLTWDCPIPSRITLPPPNLTSSPYEVKSFSTSIKSSVSASLTLSPVVGP